MFSCNIVIAVWVKSGNHRRMQKLYVEKRLTAFYRRTGMVPPIGFRLKTGDIVIEKKCDEKSIFLFIKRSVKPIHRFGVQP